MIDPDTTEQLSRKYKIDNFTIVREYFQLLFLKYLYQNRKSNKVYFKGGTAIHFIYKSFRFSEDLDFTSVVSKDQTKQLVLESFESFKQEALRVELDQRKTILGLKYRIKHFPTETAQALSIRLDFSFREKPMQTDVTSIETDYPIFPYPLVSHLDAEELLAEKIRALLVRAQPRDLFDLWFLLSKKVLIKNKLVEKKLAVYPELKIDNVRAALIKKIQQISPNQLKQDLNRFLPDNYRKFHQQLPNLIIEKLKSEW